MLKKEICIIFSLESCLRELTYKSQLLLISRDVFHFISLDLREAYVGLGSLPINYDFCLLPVNLG